MDTNDIAIILASHGLFALEARRSVEMILGYPLENLGVISVTEGKDYDTALAELNDLYEDLDVSRGLLILTDIYGGTPSNIAAHLALTHGGIEVISGFNLPVLLEMVHQRYKSLDEISQVVMETYQVGMTNISDRLKRSNEDGDQMDSY